MVSKLYVKQDSKSATLKIACRLLTDDDPQIQLIPGRWVKVSTCAAGQHKLRVGTILNQGMQKVTLTLYGGTHNGATEIKDLFHAPTDGTLFDLVVP